MAREDLTDLIAFVTVAGERSFTRGAAKLGVSPSALSHTIRRFEERLGLRVLARTTRSVSLTEAGERLFRNVAPRLSEIDAEIDALSALRDKPAGTIRITATDFAADTILWPRLRPFLPEYPDIKVEIFIDYGLTDIVQQRFDAGVRSGEQVARDMIATRIGPDWRMAVVASPNYLKGRKRPKSPHELSDHQCINLRLTSGGGLYAWELQKGGRNVHVRVDGQLTFNSTGQILKATVDGFGIGHVPESLVRPLITEKRLVPLLVDWWPTYPGYHLYYPSRRQLSPAFSLLVQTLRYRGGRVGGEQRSP